MKRTITVAALLGATLAAGPAPAQMGGKHGGHEGHDMGGGGKGDGHSMSHAPGSVQPMCHGSHGDMPPHYCDPVFKVVSSVPGVRIGQVDIVDGRTLRATLHGAGGALVVVGGAGRLAGASTLAAGWKDGATTQLRFEGEDSLHLHQHVHLHVFPLTSN